MYLLTYLLLAECIETVGVQAGRHPTVIYIYRHTGCRILSRTSALIINKENGLNWRSVCYTLTNYACKRFSIFVFLGGRGVRGSKQLGFCLFVCFLTPSQLIVISRRKEGMGWEREITSLYNWVFVTLTNGNFAGTSNICFVESSSIKRPSFVCLGLHHNCNGLKSSSPFSTLGKKLDVFPAHCWAYRFWFLFHLVHQNFIHVTTGSCCQGEVFDWLNVEGSVKIISFCVWLVKCWSFCQK